MITFREATRGDVTAVVALLSDGLIGRDIGASPEAIFETFDAMQAAGHTRLIVGQDATGRSVATYQITCLLGLSLTAPRRAVIEGVRVAGDLRGRGLGARLMADAEDRARAAGCTVIQLTTNATRQDAHRFYTREGYVPSHLGFKKPLG